MSTEDRVMAPIKIPMSDLAPPWLVMNRGKRKKLLRLVMIKKLANAIRMNCWLYNCLVTV
jgi:ubiquitin C-terminal hydrolase